MNNDRPDPGSTLRTRATLLFKVRSWDDTASWEEFHRLYRRLIEGRARRAGLSHEDAQDVAQDVFRRVAETISTFDTDPNKGSFRGWLMKLTHWRIADKFESRGRMPLSEPRRDDADPNRTSTVERIPAPVDDEDEWDREWQQHLLAAAMDRVARRTKPRHFQVFDLHFREQWSIVRISRELGINPASIYVICHRLTKQVKEEVKKLQSQLG